jgi:hypothetical protein
MAKVITDRTAGIGRNQADQFGDRQGKPADMQLAVEKQRSDTGVGQQVV